MAKLKYGPNGPIKLCPGGCRSAAVGPAQIAAMFDRDLSRGDGYRTYCKECRARKRRQGRGR